ncbi:RNA polymerase sigma factor [Phaeodactylibacter luteus]|uniref:RNA polymerase sigma factor n=1 Tax=Phaeodactylibacter luteus TaxID=1564516 RepID=UPI0014787F12|nr:sigma-70 family RNA polymerase sigma factor [Phaeodactylibacter luteus]
MEVSRDLIQGCLKNDRRAQFALYKLCYPPLMAVCLRYRSNQADANSILNQAFLKILDHLDQLGEEVPFLPWAKRITINTLIDDFRKNRKVKELIALSDKPGEDLETAPVDYNEAEKQFDAEQLEAMVQQLPPVSAKVFNLFAIDGYNHAEIAALLDISEGTSRWHLSSARKKLKDMMSRAMGIYRAV